MTRLPLSDLPLIALAKKTSNQQAIRNAIKHGVINFFLEAWIDYASAELRDKNMLDGMTAVGGLDLGRKLFENIEEDFLAEEEKQIAKAKKK